MQITSSDEFIYAIKESLEGNRSAQGAVKDLIAGALHMGNVREAISSDQLAPWFHKAVAPTFESEYAKGETTWQKFASSFPMTDFRPVAFYELQRDAGVDFLSENGGRNAPQDTLPAVPELTPYPTFGYRAGGKMVTGPTKHGVRVQFSWEALINDDWNLLERFPSDAAELANRTIDAAVYGVLWSLDPTKPGFNTSVIADGNGTVLQASKADGAVVLNDVKKNAPLTYDSLRAAIKQVRNTKVNGRYVTVNKFALIVPTTLVDLATALINREFIEETVTEGNAARKYRVSNPLQSQVEVVGSDLPLLLGGDNAATNWVIAPYGGRTTARQTILRTSLRGFEQPELRVADDTGRLFGGGSLDSKAGSFDNDDTQARVRLVTGGAIVNYDGIVASTGKGV